MEIFKKKSIVLKIVIAVVFVILFNFCSPTVSLGADGLLEQIGGTLLSPIVDLLLAIGDGTINLIQSILFGIDNSLTKVAVPEAGFWETVAMWAGAILGIAFIVGVTILTGGTALAAIIPGIAFGVGGAYVGHEIAENALPQTFYLPIYVISPEEIFQNKIGLLDVNFFNPNSYEDYQTQDGQTVSQDSTASFLQSTISSWYLTLRNFALVVLLSVLVYVGIRIIISSTAQDKAKYKEKLFSWGVAVALLFFMHYIMAFATTVVEAISEGINRTEKPVIVMMPDLEAKEYQIEIVDEKGETGGVPAYDYFSEAGLISDSGVYTWPTNLMGTLRIDMQMNANLTEDNQLLSRLGYVVLFLVMVFYTVAFLVMYIKRLIMLAFLTMIAPLVAMTYPLDKMNDGNAQAFNMWLKEYIFNLLLQPFHLILYTMLVGSAIDFANENMIYSIVAIGFIFQAEKILRRFFGFDKAGTLDSNGSTVGGMLAMAGINQLKRIGGRGSKGGQNKNNTNQNNNSKKPRYAEEGKGFRDRLDTAQNNQNNLSNQENPSNQLPESSQDNRQQLNNRAPQDEEQLRRQQMLDAYDENYGTDEWNPQERDAMARDINMHDTNNSEEPMYNRDEYAQILRDSGYNEDEVQAMLNDDPRYANNNTAEPEEEPDRTITGRRVERGLPSDLSATNPGRRSKGGKAKARIKGVAGLAGAGLKYAIPRAGKLYAKAGLGLAAATIGVAGGLASGDDMNILKYGAAGGAAGWSAAGGAIGLAKNASDKVENFGETVASKYTLAAYGEEGEKRRLQAKEDKAAMKDKNRQAEYMEKLGVPKDEIKQVMEEAQQYRESGVTDDRIIINAMNANEFGKERASNEKIILAQMATKTGNDNKKIAEMEKRLVERGFDATVAKKYADAVRKITDTE